jgi:MscS family membrane protein
MVLAAGIMLFMLTIFCGAWAVEKDGGPTAPKAAQAPAAQESPSDDPLGRSTPQGTVLGFMRAVNREDYERAIEYLDTRQPPKRAEQLAVELQFVIDRGLSGTLNNLNREPGGDLGDGLRPNRERVGTVRTSSEMLDIQLERVQRGDDPPVWLFSSDTLRGVQRVYDQLDTPFVDRFLPTALTQKRILHISLWRWLSFIVVLPLLIVVTRLISLALIFLLRPVIRRLAKRDDDKPIERVKNPFNLLILALAIYAYSPLTQSALSRLLFNQIALTLTVVSLTWLCLRLIDVSVERTTRSYHMTPASGRIAITRLGGQFSKGIAMIAGAAVILYIAGINLTAVLTGLGVGGIAVAFAAQKTLENLFGGIMIASDQPIRVGDLCRVGEYSGTVESIGLRSTRIRTLDRTIVSVPNGQLSVMSLENFAMRDKIRFNHTIGLRSETSAGQLRRVLTETRDLLSDHPKVERSSVRVRLVAVKNSGVEIELFAYVMVTSLDLFLETQEEILLRVIDIVEESGAIFASHVLPGFVAAGPDSTKGRKGEKGETRKKRNQGELELPG